MAAASCTAAVLVLAIGALRFHCAAAADDTAAFDFVPDVVKSSPESVLKITYGAKDLSVGGELTPTEVKSPPTVSWPAADDDYYTLCMVDPDAPSRSQPTISEFLHWLVVNVPGNGVAAGEELAQYVGSGPPKGTGLHRYVFLLFKQPGRVAFGDELRGKYASKEGRVKFSVQKFADTYGFQQPAAAGNFYVAKWDAYVPILHQMLDG